MAVDSVVWLALFAAAVSLVAVPTGQVQSTATGVSADLEGASAGAALALWLGISVGYHALLEWRFGETVGKHLVKIRVTADDGTPPSFRSTLARNALRLVDWLPMFYVVGIGAVTLSTERKRLGDRVGGTVVVR